MSYALIVDGAHLREGLKWFAKIRKVKAKDRACISFDRSFVAIEALDRSFLARATGEWPGTAQAPATLVVALAKAPPTTEDVLVRFADGKLRVGTLSLPCHWTPVSEAALEAKPAADWISALSLKYRLPRARIVAEGLAASVEDAERQLDRLIARCAKSLALHVTEADLRELSERRLLKHAQNVSDWAGRRHHCR
jgi:hypothetical protein